jgi:hypothetical protein
MRAEGILPPGTMNRRKKQRGQDSLPFFEGWGEGVYPSGQAYPLVIGPTTDGERRVYSEDVAGNLILADSVAATNLTDPLWGLHYGPEGGGGVIVGRCPAMVGVFQRMVSVVGCGHCVSVTGPTGSGKEEVGKAFAAAVGGPFKPVLCGALPETLFESELFGHTKGAFTGADRDVPGWVEVAEKGVLLLDEFTEIPPQMQIKVLRFIETGEFSRVGEKTKRWGRTWTIIATNRCLEAEVREGRFREDLYFRICSISLSLPPLSERGEDVLMLAAYFILKNNIIGRRKITTIDRAAVTGLRQYPWPGNVRELKNTIDRAYWLGSGPVFRAEELPDGRALQLGSTCPAAMSSKATRPPRSGSRKRRTVDDLHVLHYLQPLRRAVTVGEVAKEFAVGEWTIQRCFRQLVASGDVIRTRAGTQRLYSAVPPSPIVPASQALLVPTSLHGASTPTIAGNGSPSQRGPSPANGAAVSLRLETGS